MPKPINHIDAYGWQTPALKRVLDSPPEFDGQSQGLEDLATPISQRFSALGMPIHVKDIDITPTQTRYHLLPNDGQVMPEQALHAVLRSLMPDLDAQAVQLLYLTPGDPTVTLILRTAENRTLSLRDLLEHPDFTENDSYTSIALGLDFKHSAILYDLNTTSHLLIVGESAARLHMLMTVALTLCLFNSPSYLRLTLVGDSGSQLRHLSTIPHAVGNMVTSIDGFRSMAEGMMKHATQRANLLHKHGVDTLDQYNTLALSNKKLKPMPRLVILLDSVAIPKWRIGIDEWYLPLNEILSRGAASGLHVVMTTPALTRQNLPERLGNFFKQKVVMRSSLLQMGTQYTLPPNIPLEFVDALLVEENQEDTPIAIELPTISEAETTRTVKIWGELQASRNALQQRKGKPASTGNTGLLTLRKDIQPGPITSMIADSREKVTVSESVIAAASALAAYVGWLSVGPLREVLELSSGEAEETLRILIRMGVLEAGDGPVWRFARLADPPPEK